MNDTASAVPEQGRVTGRSFRKDGSADLTIALDDVPAAIADPEQLVWVDVVAPTQADLTALETVLNVDPSAVEDAVAPHERAKVTHHGDHLFFVVYATRLGGPDATPTAESLELLKISGFLWHGGLVTIRPDDRFDLGDVVSEWEQAGNLLSDGSGLLLHGLLDEVVDGHLATIQRLDEAIDDLEDTLFGDHPPDRSFSRTVYDLRKALTRLRRVVLPTRDAVAAVVRHQRTASPHLAPLFDDLDDHALRAAEWTDAARDLLTSTFETNLALQDARLNEVMKRLAGWAAIIAVPTAVTGWFGQNIPFPGFGQYGGLVSSVVLIVVLSVTLFVVFRRKNWV